MPPREFEVELTLAAEKGLASLNHSEQIQVFKQLEKLKRAPELGEPLGNKLGLDLTGYRKMYAAKKRVRVIYEIAGTKLIVTVIAIGPREDARVYRIASSEAKNRRLRKISGGS
jgi:mRNA interferase RelE/StbE